MAEDSRAKLTLDGDVSPLKAKLRDAGDAINRFGDQSKRAIDGLGSPLALLTTRFGALSVVLAAGGFAAFIKSSIDAKDALNDMNIRTGVAVQTLAGLEYAAKLGDVSMQDLATGVGRLSKFIGEAEGGNKKFQEILKLLGITAKDPERALIQLADATGRLHNPTERAAVLSQLLGKNYQALLPLLADGGAKLQQLIERGRELNPTTAESAKQAAEFNDRVDELSIGVKNLGTDIASKLLPSLLEITTAAKDAAKEHGVLYTALIAVGTAFKNFLDGGASSPIQKQQTFVKGLETDLIKLQEELVNTENKSIARLFRRDPQQIRNEINGIKLSLTDARFALIELENKKLGFGDSGGSDVKKPGINIPKNLFGSDSAGKKETKPPDSYLQYYEAALDNEKRLAYERDALRGYSKQEELSYWQFLQNNADLRSKDIVAIQRKVSDLIVDIKRKEAQEKLALDAEDSRARESRALNGVEIERVAAQGALEIDQISKAQFLQMEQEFERRKFEIQQAALLERQKELDKYPSENAVELEILRNRMLEIEQQYHLRRLQIGNQAQQEEGAIWERLTDRISSLWDRGLQALLNGTLTFRNAMRAIYAELGNFIITEFVLKPVKKWIAEQVKMLALKLGFATQETAIETAKSSSTIGTKGTEALAVVGANAAEAASGAAASVASVPYVGPFLAGAAFGAILSLVLGAKSNIKSAAKGYDIPSGLNPIAQLHQEEMVLPAQYANVIRGLAGQTASADSDGGAAPIHIYARNDSDVVRVGDMKRLLKSMRRDFVDVGRK